MPNTPLDLHNALKNLKYVEKQVRIKSYDIEVCCWASYCDLKSHFSVARWQEQTQNECQRFGG
jgi:hypothetical protein